MSQFKTSIPVNVQEVIDTLPKRSYVETAKLAVDRKSVEIVWGCDDLKTGFTFPVECPLDQVNSPPGTTANRQSPIANRQNSETKAPKPVATVVSGTPAKTEKPVKPLKPVADKAKTKPRR